MRDRTADDDTTRLLHLLIVLSISALIVVLATAAFARDLGQWDGADPETRAWFNSLMQPDNKYVSCCGDADAYFADDFRVVDGTVVVTITDNRGHALPVGTTIAIPPNKLSREPNRLGHSIVFIGGASNDIVYCFIPSSGV